MSNMDDVIAAALIASIVAGFLVNTSRAYKAIELCKEGLSIVNSSELIKQNQLYKQLNKAIHLTLARAYSLINDYPNEMKYARKILHIYQESGERAEECAMSIELGKLYLRQKKNKEANELFEKALLISTELGDNSAEATCYGNLGALYQAVGVYDKAKQYYEKALAMSKQIGDRKAEGSWYERLGCLFLSVREYQKAIEYLEEALAISKETGDRKGEGTAHGYLGNLRYLLGEYQESKKYLEKALTISVETGYRKGEASSLGMLGNVFESIGEYRQAQESYEKALSIYKEIGDKRGEASCYGDLGNAFQAVGDYQNAKKYHENALSIRKEIGDRKGESHVYGNLGILLHLLGQYREAKEYLEETLSISKELGDKQSEAFSYGNLGNLHQSVREHNKAKEYYEKALAISKEIGDKMGEAFSYGNIGNVFRSVGEYQKAKKYYEKALAMRKGIGDKKGVGDDYGNLGLIYQLVGEYQKAKEYQEEALAISKEIGDKKGEASSYLNLGNVFRLVGEHQTGKEYYENALAIQKEIGDRVGEAYCYGNVGNVFLSVGDYQKAKEHFEDALAFTKEVADRKGESDDCAKLGSLFLLLGDYEEAREYYGKALVISKEIGDREGEASRYGHLATIFQILGNYVEAEEYHKRGLAICQQIGDIQKQFYFFCRLASLKLAEGKIQEALTYLTSSIDKCEDLRGFLGENDQFKISFSHENIYPYHELSALLCCAGKFQDALYVSELGRARALADLMSARYLNKNPILVNRQSRVAIEGVMDRERNCTCLYFSYLCGDIFLWILRAGRISHFRKVNGREILVREGLVEDLDDFFVKESFRGFRISPGEHREDQLSKNIQRQPKPGEKDCFEILRTGTENDKGNDEVERTLSLCYKLIIAPVVDLIDDAEIIIVPERSLYNIPFAALRDDTGKYLSETYRIRIVPSLTTLKLIQDSPAEYHSQTGALIVGNPDVGRVRYKRRRKNISRLPHAENEAIMVGEMLGVEPLLGKQATKQAVIQDMNSVGLIHFAAHGFEEEGEIALAPSLGTSTKIPKEEDYLLTMSDISKVRLRAKLVVLSCCHSARGQIKAEGVVGIARAFLGSGARSVLVALWRVQDSATEQFMSRFYEHLVSGQNAGESPHAAMKWMRCNRYSDVRQWAPFMLIGDNVAFDFGKN